MMIRKGKFAGLAALCFAALFGATAGSALADGKEKLTGTWDVDFEKTIERLSDAKEKEQVQQARDLGIKLSLTLKADGTASMDVTAFGEPKKEPGKWKVTKEDGKKVSIELTKDSSDDKDDLTATFLEDDLILMEKDGEKLKFAFSRAKE